MISFTGLAYGQTVPDRPENLQADDISPTKIDLSWDAPEDDGGSPITGYRIEVKAIPNDYTVLVGDTGTNSTTYLHSGLQTGTTYIYRIFAINDVGTSQASLEAVGKPTSSSTPPEQIPPNPPTQLNATDVSPTQIDLTWEKPTDNAGPSVTGYQIERKTSSSSYITLVENTGSVTKYSDTNVQTNTNYIYRVFAINSVDTSGSSNEATATPTTSSAPEPELIVPNRPTILSVEPLSNSELLISWKQPADNDGPAVTGYKIEVSTDSKTYSVIAENTGLVYNFQHTNLNSETKYTYRISAINSVGTSEPSSVKSAIPKHTLVPKLVATAVSPTQIDLTWNPPSQTYGQDIIGYTIQEKIANGVYETIESIGRYTEYSLTDLETDKEYAFVVFARYTLGSSDISNEATATPTESSKPSSSDMIPTPPRNLKAVASSPIQIDLSWDVPTSDGGSKVTGYKIDVRIGSGSYFTLTKNTGTTTKAYTHTDREPGKTYTYRVYAVNSVGTSGPSNEATATPNTSSTHKTSGTTPSVPTNLKAVLVSPNQVNLSWGVPNIDGGSQITSYRIESKTNSGGFYVLSNTAKTSYFHTGLLTGNTYTYRVFAINSIGASNPSGLASITIAPEIETDPTKRIPGFPDPAKDPQSYVDRYNNEPNYKDWFNSNFPDYTIYEVVGLPEPSDEDIQEPEENFFAKIINQIFSWFGWS